MKRILVLVLACIALGMLASGTTLAAPVPKSSPRTPNVDAPSVIDTEFKINVVFVGYEEADIDMPTFEAGLANTYDPVVLGPLFHGIDLPVNIHGDYSYNYVWASEDFNDAFFSYLASHGRQEPLTDFQAMYNEQVHKTATVSDTVLYVDAPQTELWLMNNGRSQLGLDVANYTIFFVNWYHRDDFQFHVYTKTDSPDPDTGYNFGLERDSRAMIAWGGTYGRTWFYDLSAGPEAWTGNWNVDDADVDGDDTFDYRMPPIWEYGNLTGYRPFDDLSGDLAKVARYVAIDMLFTTAPAYDPLASEPFPGRGKRVIINMFEDDPSSNGMDWIHRNYIIKTMQKFQKQFKWKVKIKNQVLVDPALTAFRIWSGVNPSDDCWNTYGDRFSELFCFFDANRTDYIPPIRPARNYIGGVYAFNTTDENMGDNGGLLGFADEDWVSGTPTYVFEFDTPGARDAGFGFSTTTTHEFGHLIGMMHPHDGYDSELGVEIDAGGDYYYAWSGDESHTVMQYIAVANEFGWFDRDNMNRFLIGRYLERSAEITAEVRQATGSAETSELLSGAESDLSGARAAYAAMDYESAVVQAKAGFERVYRAAQVAGLNIPIVEPLPASAPPHGPKTVDPIRFPNN